MQESDSCQTTEILILENDALRVTVLPGHGAKISNLRSKIPDVEWLWTNPTLSLDSVNQNGMFDDNFYGGIDELFPNDLPTSIEGRDFPDHGEFWRRAWSVVHASGDQAMLTVDLKSVPVRVNRNIQLRDNQMVVRTEIENLSVVDIPYLWVSHPAFFIDVDCELYIPPGRTVVQDQKNGRVKAEVPPFLWPGTELGVDLNHIPAAKDAFESYYIVNVPEGRFQVHRAGGAILEVQFPTTIFPHLWLFLPLGGWRGHTLALLEAASGYPTDLADAIRMGTHTVLLGRQRVKAEMTYSIFSDKGSRR